MNLRLISLTSGLLTATALGACSRDEIAPWGFAQDLTLQCDDTSSATPMTLTVGQEWSWQPVAKGGKAPLKWAAENLPPGLTIDPNTGLISGTPTAAGDFDLRIIITDADGNAIPFDCATLTVNEPDRPAIDCVDDSGSIPDGFTTIDYSFEVSAPGGATPYTWDVKGLPPGLTWTQNASDPTKITIAGVPTMTGIYPVEITITDAGGEVTMISCGDLVINDPISVDTDALLAAFPDGCVDLGVSLQELLDKKILVGGDDTPITCELRTGRGMGSGKFTGDKDMMPPGIKLDVGSCTVSGPVSSSLPFGIYAFITTYSQSGLDAFVPYCAPQMTQAPTAYDVFREDTGMTSTFKPGVVVVDYASAAPEILYGTDTPDPKVTVTDDVGACAGNTCFYAFVFAYNALSGNATVSANPNAKFPAQGFDGFTHGVRIGDKEPSLIDRFRGRAFVTNVQYDYCIADNGDDCGNNEPDSAKRAALVRMNGGGSNYYFSLVVLPKN